MIDLFNRMITHLRNERLSVRGKNRFLDLLIQASPQGIVILNFNKEITDINPAGLKILRITHPEEVKGKRLEEAPFELAAGLATLKQGDNIILRTNGISAYRCIRSSFVDQGFDHPFILIEELTQELLQVEKSSYERIIRMMSHEVNNSVGAISATLNVVSDIFTTHENQEWQDVLPAVNASFDRCNHLAHFISNLAHVVRIPLPTLSHVSLNELARSVEALVRPECKQRNIHLHLDLTPNDKLIYIDGIQFEQVLVNLLKNAYESINHDGEIRILTHSSPVSITIEDNGPGIPDEVKDKLFTPFFTTKPTGQGIGLLFVREVLTNHKCGFTLTTQATQTCFRITF
ncbi:MAG: ATP-binding protein [Tannerellaceae bacterium]|nr:ATP-binding protein [Tannerellaceae bacterium]